jgi:hypothetical protein
MTPRNHTTSSDLDDLIDQITADCHDGDEQLMSFANAFDEVCFPYPASVIGEAIEVLSVIVAARPELVATCTRAGRHYNIALLDIEIDADPTTSRLIAAYRRWAGSVSLAPE